MLVETEMYVELFYAVICLSYNATRFTFSYRLNATIYCNTCVDIRMDLRISVSVMAQQQVCFRYLQGSSNMLVQHKYLIMLINTTPRMTTGHLPMACMRHTPTTKIAKPVIETLDCSLLIKM